MQGLGQGLQDRDSGEPTGVSECKAVMRTLLLPGELGRHLPKVVVTAGVGCPPGPRRPSL